MELDGAPFDHDHDPPELTLLTTDRYHVPVARAVHRTIAELHPAFS
jgi:hypothetical protein